MNQHEFEDGDRRSLRKSSVHGEAWSILSPYFKIVFRIRTSGVVEGLDAF